MENEQARVLGRDSNAAVVHLQGRAFPGIHVQGDTFAELQRQFADVAGWLRRTAGGGSGEASNDLEYAVAEMAQMLCFYEAVLTEHGIPRPYGRDETS